MKFLALLTFALLGIANAKGAWNDLPPSEFTCSTFVGCNFFPQNRICGLAENGCFGPHTFGNDCELGVYNCEHPSNQFYKYWDGSCNPDEDMFTISPIEFEPITVTKPPKLYKIGPMIKNHLKWLY